MKILYGVQGTGNGHITRANAISEVLATQPGVEVTWLLSGREANGLLEVKGSTEFRRGLTFASQDGKICYRNTLLKNNPFVLLRDIARLDLTQYDCLVTDYEPVVSWAAKYRGRETIGIGHQYAFKYPVPRKGHNAFNMGILNQFAPADIGLGLHWHHFGYPVLPPICDVPKVSEVSQDTNKIVVYLPFENQESVIDQLRALTHWDFYLYSPQLSNGQSGNIHRLSLSRAGFKQDLMTCAGVITNTGFELISECLSLGIKVLTKPLDQQVEQLSNGAALDLLGYAEVVKKIETASVRHWLEHGVPVKVTYPAVHEAIGQWLVAPEKQSIEALSEGLWRNVIVHRGLQTISKACPQPSHSGLRTKPGAYT